MNSGSFLGELAGQRCVAVFVSNEGLCLDALLFC